MSTSETESEESARAAHSISLNNTDEIHIWTNVSERPTGEDMDHERERLIAYNYLCRLEEAKRWMEAMSKSELPAVTDGMEESLANGIALAKLGKCISPDMKFKIFDENAEVYHERGLHFRHTDNINAFRRAMTTVKLPIVFYPETTDIYDKKNLPRLIYCIHALALHLFKCGKAPKMDDLEGILKFTEEEISAMQQALEGYDIKLPVFAKIGGILAAEISEDEAILHAAILCINLALDKGCFDEFKGTLLNPDAQLVSIYENRIGEYEKSLKEAKCKKVELHLESSSIDAPHHDSSFTIDNEDFYSVRLNQKEIQSEIKLINFESAIRDIPRAFELKDKMMLKVAVRDLNLRDYFMEGNSDNYFNEHLEFDSLEDITVKTLGEFFHRVNLKAEKDTHKKDVLNNVKRAIKEQNSEELVQQLRRPDAELPPITDVRPDVYLRELETYEELSSDILYENLEAISSLANANGILESRSHDMSNLCNALGQLNIVNFNTSLINEYEERLTEEYERVVSDEDSPDHRRYLSTSDFQRVITNSNNENESNRLRLSAVQHVNDMVTDGDEEAVLEALQNPILELEMLNPKHASRYLAILQWHLETSEEVGLGVIRSAVIESGKLFEYMGKRCSAVVAINLLLDQDDDQDEEDPRFREMLEIDVLEHHIIAHSIEAYQEALQDAKMKKDSEIKAEESDWITEVIEHDHSLFYFDTRTLQGSWKAPVDFLFSSKQKMLDSVEIKRKVDEVTAALNQIENWKDNESYLVKLQSAVRMYQQRKKFNNRLNYINDQTEAAQVIAAHYRGWKVRGELKRRKKLWRTHIPDIIKIQSLFRMLKERLRYTRRLAFFKDNDTAIIMIQAWWRGCYLRNDYRGLSSGGSRLSAIRHFVHLLDQTELDLNEEEEICQLKKEIITRIRENEDLDEKVVEMDVKIGLLVKNRISLNEAHTHLKKIKKHGKMSNQKVSTVNLGRLNKETQIFIEGYEKLFTLLQTEPVYFAKLLFCLPTIKSNSFIQNVVFATYDYAQNTREQFLLLKLFQSALEEEIAQKVSHPKDLMTSNALAVKLIVNYYRGIGMKVSSGTNYGNNESLRDILGERVKDIITRGNELNLEWSIIEIYKKWVQQKETENGVQIEPESITEEKAEAIPEVADVFRENIATLCGLVDSFLTAITGSVKSLPYGLRYQSKIMYNALSAKFPQANDDTILLSVGYLVYYRFLNPAICAPEVFDLVDLPTGTALDRDIRKKLGQIARFLQHSASHTSGSCITEGSLPVRTAQHPEIEAATKLHAKRFQTFFKAVINVPEPEEQFGVSEYSDVVQIEKPRITLTIKDLLDTHKLCSQFEESIGDDQMHQVLSNMKELPEPEILLGADCTKDYDQDDIMTANIRLTLHPVVSRTDEEILAAEMRCLLNESKRMLCNSLKYHSARYLREFFTSVLSQEVMDKYASANKQRDFNTDRQKIQDNINVLIKNNVLDNEDDLVKIICQEIKEQHRLRHLRKAELEQLKLTRARLMNKRSYYEDQREYFDKYIADCLLKQTVDKDKAKTPGSKRTFRAKKPLKEIKYNAEQLMKKGVLISLTAEGVKNMKHLKFIIKPITESGQWSIDASYLGVSVVTTRLVLQELLQKQYENVSVIHLEGKAKVNVNLLLHLLNKKFHTSSTK